MEFFSKVEENQGKCILRKTVNINFLFKMELLAHTENTDDSSHVFVLRVHSSGVNTNNGNLSIYGLQDHHLIDRMSQVSTVEIRVKITA